MAINFYTGINFKMLNEAIANYKLTPYYKGEDSYLIMNSDTLEAIKASNSPHLVAHSDKSFTYGWLTIAISEKLKIGEIEFR